MKWKQMSAFHKAAAIIGALSGVVYIVLAALEAMHILSNIHTIAQIFLSILFLSYGVLFLKQQRDLAIFWLILGGGGMLLSLVYLII